MWQEKQTKLLRDEIEALIAPLSDLGSLYDLVKEPLTQVRRGLAHETSYDQPWPLLLLMVCEAISGRYEHALPAAATFQLLIAAGDVFDDIEDADSSESLAAKYGTAIATNIAATLLILAERGVTRLKSRGVEDCITVDVINTVNSYYAVACAGQNLDLHLASEFYVSEETYLKVIGMKSASQIECACRIGALLAGANHELIDTLSIFGHNLGIIAQINNDIQDIIKGSHSQKLKISLPVTYALTQADDKVCNQLRLMFNQQFKSLPDPIQIRDLLFQCGAIHYATVKMEFYKQLALDNLSEAERHGTRVERLKLFLE